jgi:hypothetical protein
VRRLDATLFSDVGKTLPPDNRLFFDNLFVFPGHLW